jgi:CPA1 family monovalent cation:H+ antiporter
LYESAWQVSWKQFWKWRRVITGFAFPVVILNACVVAFFSAWLIPEFTLALGFLLGGIISPPDAVSATTIMRRVNVPRGMMSIIEGESLLNDASSLIVFRFALAAIITGQFRFQDAALSFFVVIFGGVAVGLLVGLIFYAVTRWLPTTTSIDIVLSLVTPYCMYYAAEQFHVSGVLAVVCGGLFLSSRRDEMLSYRSRIEGVNVWTNFVFVLNGLIFLLIGLQLPSIIGQLGDGGLGNAVWYGLAISFVLIVTRLVCALGSSVFTTFMSNFITVADAHPGWRNPLIFGWSGMRGVVSLAMALSIPVVIGEGQFFPYRNLILFITFVVILVTLCFQGLTLPWLIRKIKPEPDKDATLSDAEQELIIQKKIALYSLKFLEENYGERRSGNDHLDNLFKTMEINRNFFEAELEETDESRRSFLRDFQCIYLEMLERQRDLLNQMNRKNEFDEELIRKYLGLIDVEEFKIREKRLPEVEA